MAKGLRISPFLMSSKSSDSTPADLARSQTAPNSARLSSSSIFPGLRRLETTGSDRVTPDSSRRSTSSLQGVPVAAAATSSSTSSGSSSAQTTPPIITLKLTGPSFLDVVAKDSVTKQPLYIMETVRDSTFVYRLDSATQEAVKAATVQWPQSVTKTKSSGRTISMHNGRWRDTEEFLKFGTLTNFLNRRFHIPHFPHPLKWKPAPGSSFHCTAQGVKGPIAVLEAAYLEAPPRLRVYHTLSDDERERRQTTYNGVPVVLLDYLMVTSLLLVTDVQEWLDRKQSGTGTTRIPGSSSTTVQRWLAIIHNEPLPPSPTATSPTSAASGWDTHSRNRMSGGASSVAGSNSSNDILSPSTPATSAHSNVNPWNSRDGSIPPVPPLPQAARTSRPTLHVSQPPRTATGGGGASSSEPSPSASVPGPSSAPVTGAYPSSVSSRPLPRLPIKAVASAASLRPTSTDRVPTPSASLSPSLTPVQPIVDRPASPSTSSSSGTASRNPQTGPRRVLTVANLPPASQPPSSSLPLPPKLAQESGRQKGDAPSYDQQAAAVPSRLGSGLQMTNPDPLSPEEEEQLRQNMQALSVSRPGPSIRQGTSSSGAARGTYVSMMVPASSGMMVDAGVIHVPSMNSRTRRRSYAETVYEQPPPAYDAIDFTLQAQVQLAPHETQPQTQP